MEVSQLRKSEIYIPPLHPKQREAFYSVANEKLYGGATRGGKSHYSRVQLIVFCSLIENLQCDIFRLHYDDVIKNHMHGRHSFPDLLGPWIKDGLVKINQTEVKFLQTGSIITLEHCSSDDVMQKHQGIPKHIRVFEEATQIPERRIKWLRAWVTMPVEMKALLPSQIGHLFPDLKPEQVMELLPMIIYTANPIGPSSGYFRRNFVQARPRMAVGRAPDDDGGFLRVYIPALVEDNPSEDAAATRRRVSGMGDEAITDALLNENWDAPVGDFFREWDEKRHVIPDQHIPPYWYRFRTFDWGTAEPFAVYWWAVSPGETLGDTYIPRGALVAYREWYGCDPKKPEEGLRMRNEDIAKGVLSRTEKSALNQPTLTDSLPFQDRGGETIAKVFAREGVVLTLGDTSRVPGWSQLRGRLIGIEIDSNDKTRHPLIYFMESCKYARDYLPTLQRHPNERKKEDAQEHGEATHSPDAIRIACMAFKVIKDSIQPVAERIQSEVQERPTVKKLLKLNGHGYFD